MAEIVTPQLVFYVAVVITVFLGLQMGAAVMVYAERKVSAFMQQRFGVTRRLVALLPRPEILHVPQQHDRLRPGRRRI